MAYDELLANRIREVMGERARSAEIKMFGGLCFTVRGNMVVGVVGDELMVRVGPEQHDDAITKPGARVMDFTKKPMRGFLYVGAEGIKTKRALAGWIDRALAFNATLPEKKPKPRKPRAAKAKKPAVRR